MLEDVPARGQSDEQWEREGNERELAGESGGDISIRGIDETLRLRPIRHLRQCTHLAGMVFRGDRGALAPSFFLLGTIDTWQLIINTVTTIVTFLLVALLQNTQKRSDDAVQHKLNAIADGLADLMKQLSKEHPPELDKDLKELRLAVGLEDHESAS